METAEELAASQLLGSFQGLADRQWQVAYMLREATYERDGADLQTRGLYIDAPAWGSSVFKFS